MDKLKLLWQIRDEWMQDGEELCGSELREMSKRHAEQLRKALVTLEQPGEKSLRLRHALKAILEIGKRDLSNPKYDGYFEEARLAIILCEIDGTLSKIEGEEVV
jgi:hypothetical protein